MSNSPIVYIQNKKHLEEVLQKDKVIIDYYAIWCDDCDEIDPLYKKLALENSDITFAKLSVDIQELKGYYTENKIVEIPSFHLFEKGKRIHSIRSNENQQLIDSVKVLATGQGKYPPNKLAIAKYKDTVLAETSDFYFVNETVYFPLDSLKKEFFTQTEKKFTIQVNQEIVKDACTIYEPPYELLHLKDHVTFSKEIEIIKIGKASEPVTNFGLNKEYEYDLLVIGGGSGGFQLAKKAAKLGAKVGLFNYVKLTKNKSSWGLGGTCVNVGCIPKKLFHQAGILGSSIKDSRDFGWKVEKDVKHDWKTLQQNVKSYVSKLNWKHEGGLRNNRVKYYNAYASFIDSHTVLAKFDDREEKFTSKYVVIATGGRPKSLGIQGEEYCIDSDDLFNLTENPGKTLVVGGSYVAVEVAGFLSMLGIDVSLSIREKMLRGFDEECVEKVKSNLSKNGVKILMPSLPTKITKNDKLEVEFKDGSKDQYDTIISAIGRDPQTKGLDLEKVGVKVDKNGFIQVKNLQANDNIYAIGDVHNTELQLTPVAIMEGKELARILFGKSKVVINYDFIPTSIFTPEEYGSCGLSEEKAIEKYGKDDVEVYKKSVNVLEYQMGFQFSKHDQAFFKMLCIKSLEERVCGFHYIGPSAAEILVGMSIAMRFKATKEDLDNAVGIHPSLSEVITQLEKGVVRDTGC